MFGQHLDPAMAAAVLGGLGLLVGSFLNVVIYRLPIMWQHEQEDYALMDSGKAVPKRERFDLISPRSRCSNCGHQIRWYENIPLVSYMFLHGKCSACGARIGLRYPSIELLTCVLFALAGWRYGFGAVTLAWCAFSALCVTSAMIDWDTTLLPNTLTVALLMIGLGLAAAGGNPSVGVTSAVWGAVIGYFALWSLAAVWKLLRNQVAMGDGDFVLLAALGAWFGILSLVPIVLMASAIGAVVGIIMKFTSMLKGDKYVPFGPFLALGGITAMIFGPQSILLVLGLKALT
jgi:leader peptidase (prepilin peptidase) / N-methyltransferase